MFFRCSYVNFSSFFLSSVATLASYITLFAGLLFNMAQSGWVEEYTDCISADGKTPPTNVLDKTQQSDGEVSVTLELWGTQSVTSLLSLLGPHWPWSGSI